MIIARTAATPCPGIQVAADRAVECVPSAVSASSNTTDRLAASSWATEAPAMPPPTTATSLMVDIRSP